MDQQAMQAGIETSAKLWNIFHLICEAREEVTEQKWDHVFGETSRQLCTQALW